MIAGHLRDEPAAVVVPEDQPLPAVLDEMHGAATARLAVQVTALAPERRLEPARRRVAGPGGVI
jgi:hypothetical protein